MTATVFDRPQWTLLPDPKGPRVYGNVSNVLEIVRGRSSVRVAIAVPSEIFTLMREVLKVPPSAACSLSLDQVDNHFVFSLLAEVEPLALYDLWTYSSKSLPDWMLDRSFHM